MKHNINCSRAGGSAVLALLSLLWIASSQIAAGQGTALEKIIRDRNSN